MTNQQKNSLHSAAEKTAAAAADKARTATGWKKWLYFLAAIAAAGVALFTATGCAAAVRQTADGFNGLIVILPAEK